LFFDKKQNNIEMARTKITLKRGKAATVAVVNIHATAQVSVFVDVGC
jgi:hypothetical protein